MAKKVLDHELKALANQGRSVTSIAKELNVTKSCISKRLKSLGCIAVKGITLFRPDGTAGSLNMIEQFSIINREANSLLNKLIKACEKAETLPGDGVKLKDPRELLIKLIGEIKSQIGLWHEVEKTRFNAVVVREFINELIRFLEEEVGEDARKKFTDRIDKNRALRGIIQ